VQVKIQDGCDAMCAYCVVPIARGAPRSRPSDEIVAEVAGLAEAGVSEVVLTGINIGRYADGGAGLAELVRRVAETGVPRVRISSIEPQDVTNGLLEAIRTSNCVVPHFHVPLQSGCDRTLGDMGRRYDTATYAGVLERIRESVPKAAVTTDVLVGFPGERDEDFAETLAFVRACGFARLHVFRYSPRPGTAAALRSDQVPAATRAERAALMRDLGAELETGWIESRISTTAQVLVERVAHRRAWGTSEDYLSVVFEHPTDRAPRCGDLVDVVLTGRAGDAVGARVVSGHPVRAGR
jgi:threonylcarbamoyladenosine tRNA methylthiotransferase MtaB